jgi:sugar-phosphatase
VSDILLPCQGILFDCDGVLVDSVASGQRGWSQWALEYGLDPAQVLEGVHGRRSKDTVAMHVPAEQRQEALQRIDAIEIADAASTSAIPGAAGPGDMRNQPSESGSIGTIVSELD